MKNNKLVNTFTQTPHELYHLAHLLPLKAAAVDVALNKLGVLPTKIQWREWLALLFLAMGSGLLLAGVIFFFAYNWDELHRFERFAIIGSGILLSASAAFYCGVSKLSGQLLLTAASVLTGVLLATFGMVYQTGADSYQLFMTWALLIIPWVVVSRFQPLWLVALIVASLAVILWEPTTRQSLFYQISQVNWFAVCLLMGISWVVLLIREFTHFIHHEIEQGRWFPRLVAAWLIGVASYAPLNWVTHGISVEHGNLEAITLLISLAILIAMTYFYLTQRHDLFVVALLMASVVWISTAALIKVLKFSTRDAESFLLVGGFMVVAISVATKMLIHISRRWKARGIT